MSLPLTSALLLVVVALPALTVPVLGAVWWRRSVRSRRSSRARTAGRWLLVVVGQLLAVAVTFLVVNDMFSFYTSWSDLLGPGTGSTAIRSQGR